GTPQQADSRDTAGEEDGRRAKRRRRKSWPASRRGCAGDMRLGYAVRRRRRVWGGQRAAQHPRSQATGAPRVRRISGHG
ncbi:hypothetical protein THAOC_27737, partial [Thalassiosira oceanica]